MLFKRRIICVIILAVQIVAHHSESLAESLEAYSERLLLWGSCRRQGFPDANLRALGVHVRRLREFLFFRLFLTKFFGAAAKYRILRQPLVIFKISVIVYSVAVKDLASPHPYIVFVKAYSCAISVQLIFFLDIKVSGHPKFIVLICFVMYHVKRFNQYFLRQVVFCTEVIAGKTNTYGRVGSNRRICNRLSGRRDFRRRNLLPRILLIVLTMGKIPIIGCEIIVDCMPVEFDLAA